MHFFTNLILRLPLLSLHAQEALFTSGDTLHLTIRKSAALYPAPPYLNGAWLAYLSKDDTVIALNYAMRSRHGLASHPGYWHVLFDSTVGYAEETAVLGNQKMIEQFNRMTMPIQYKNDSRIVGVRRRKKDVEYRLKTPLLSNHHDDASAEKKAEIPYYWMCSIFDVSLGATFYSHYRFFTCGVVEPKTKLGLGLGLTYTGGLWKETENDTGSITTSFYMRTGVWPITLY